LSDVNASGRAVLAEGLGTALLLAIVIGSGIMGQRLSGGNDGVALLANTLATVGGLYVLIEVLAPVSGAHFNPAVSVVMVARGRLPGDRLLPYVVAQLLGAMLGAWLAHAMFDVAIFQWSTKVRAGLGQVIAEVVATAGLLLVILRAPANRVAAAVAAYIGSAYWFTASTSFANPAAAFGRMLTDSFAGIAPTSVPGFVVAELAGAALGLGLHIALGASLADEEMGEPERPARGRFGIFRPPRRPDRTAAPRFPEESASGR
jgi:glycerol uptake facilitator-like aquaporin